MFITFQTVKLFKAKAETVECKQKVLHEIKVRKTVYFGQKDITNINSSNSSKTVSSKKNGEL